MWENSLFPHIYPCRRINSISKFVYWMIVYTYVCPLASWKRGRMLQIMPCVCYQPRFPATQRRTCTFHTLVVIVFLPFFHLSCYDARLWRKVVTMGLQPISCWHLFWGHDQSRFNVISVLSNLRQNCLILLCKCWNCVQCKISRILVCISFMYLII